MSKLPENRAKVATVETLEQFLNAVVTEERIKQAIDLHLPYSLSKRTIYVAWVIADILKEHKLTMQKSGITEVQVANAVPSIVTKLVLKAKQNY